MRRLRVKFILPALTEATSPFWRPIKYSLFPPLGLATLAGYLRAGNVGVDLFFVLSGFLLALPYLADIEGGRRVSVGRYFERRALRILPAYYLAVAVVAAVSAHRPADLLAGVPWLLFLQSFLNLAPPLLPYSIPWWSLATEVQFYLALPMKPLCREGCAGLCSQCGTNLNTGTCQCTSQWEDPRLAPLKGLK